MRTAILTVALILVSLSSIGQTLESPIPQTDYNFINGVWYKTLDNTLVYHVDRTVSITDYVETLVSDNGGDFKTPVLDEEIDGTRYRRYNLHTGGNIILATDKSMSMIFWNK